MAAIRVYQNSGDSADFREFIAERVIESEKEIVRLFHIKE
jgi:hypothetical protein